MGRAPCCDKANVKKGPWSPEEDAKLKSYIEKHGMGGNWIALPQKIGLKRCGKSCRLRWLNYLRPNIKHGGFSEEEDKIILSLYVSIGSRWSIIAAQLPGRTDNDIKNYWNTRLKKKLFSKQRKDQQQFRRGSNNNLMIKQETNNYYNFIHQNPWNTTSSSLLNYNQNPYNNLQQHSMPSTSSSLLSYPNQIDSIQCLDDQVSFRKTLIKVGEEHNNNNTTITNNPSLFLSCYDNNSYINMSSVPTTTTTTTTTNTNETGNPNHNQGGNNIAFPVELEELMSSNNQRVDNVLDYLYGNYGNNLVHNESLGWNNEMSSYGNMELECSNNDVLLQGIGEGSSTFQGNLEFPQKL
ncbi:hypothetical protein vseg_017923 [Gypsophila vaccaria]